MQGALLNKGLKSRLDSGHSTELVERARPESNAREHSLADGHSSDDRHFCVVGSNNATKHTCAGCELIEQSWLRVVEHKWPVQLA